MGIDQNWPPGPSQMGALVREKDWSVTPLGSIAAWSVPLRVAVTRVHDSRLASILLWGEDLIQIYNDNYQPLLGARHPLALGQATADCWPEVWHFNEPIYKRVYGLGEVVHLEDQEFTINPTGCVRTHYFTVTYYPARDEYGSVCGVIVDVVETTDRVRLERENRALEESAAANRRIQMFSLRLSDALRGYKSADDIIAKASEMLGVELGVERVLFCDVDDSKDTFEIRRDWVRNGISSVAGKARRLADYGNEIVSALRLGKSIVIPDITLDKRATDVLENYATLGIASFIAVPFVNEGRLSVVLAAQHQGPYPWCDAELRLCEDFAERTWSSSENARAQAALKTERDQSHAVFESMTEGFGLVDEDWTVLRMNEVGLSLAQRSAEQVIGKNHWDIWPEMHGTALAELFKNVKATGEAGIFEYLHSLANGLTTWVEVRAYRTPNNGLAFFYRDIGERKSAEEKLRNADRRKDEFLAMLAHELRNPLAPISAAASVLRIGYMDENHVKKASEIISRQVSHMSNLINDLLDVSRVTRGLIKLENNVVDIQTVVADAVEQVRPRIEEKHHHLVMQTPLKKAYVRGDHKRLVQIVTNLLSNAAKYTPKGGSIDINTTIGGDEVFLTVRDNGIGMTSEFLARAFGLFEQETRTSDRSQGGLGLGLPLVKNLVGLHGGTVVASSNGPATGCELTVRLPLCAPAMTNEEVSVNEVLPSKSLQILIVDDNADAADSLSMLLIMQGHFVTVAYNGKKALDFLAKQQFDVCLLDIGLPDMSGNELATQIRANYPRQNMMLIAVTGYGQSKDELESASAGFDYHLVKPVDAVRLAELLDNRK